MDCPIAMATEEVVQVVQERMDLAILKELLAKVMQEVLVSIMVIMGAEEVEVLELPEEVEDRTLEVRAAMV